MFSYSHLGIVIFLLTSIFLVGCNQGVDEFDKSETTPTQEMAAIVEETQNNQNTAAEVVEVEETEEAIAPIPDETFEAEAPATEAAAPVEPEAADAPIENLSAVETLNAQSSEFPFFENGAPISGLPLNVRRIDASWADPLQNGGDFAFNDEYRGIRMDMGKTAEDLTKYEWGMLRLNFKLNGYTDFAGEDVDEFIGNYERSVTNNEQMPPFTVHGIDSKTGEYITYEISLPDLLSNGINHYLDIGATFSNGRGLNKFELNGVELPLFIKTGSTGRDIAHGIIIDQENNQIFAITRIPPQVPDYYNYTNLSTESLSPLMLLALPPSILGNIHTAHANDNNVNGADLGEFVNQGISLLPDTEYGKLREQYLRVYNEDGLVFLALNMELAD